jgi:hypothetical protein
VTNNSVARVGALVITLTIFVPEAGITQEPSTSIPLPATQYQLSRLAPGQTSGQAMFSLDAANIVTVLILSNDGALDTHLLGPAAQLINPSNVEGFGGVFTTMPGGAADSPLLLSGSSAGFQYVYSFPSFGAGTYTVGFSTTSMDEVAVITHVSTDSHVGAVLLSTDPTLVLGNPAVLTAAIFDGDSPVSGANVSVTVLPESGAPLSVTLHDDGGAADNMADDGLYSGEFTPAVSGKYVASAVMTGTTTGGINFTRHGATSFAVISKSSELAGTFDDFGVDDDGDGLFDLVSIFVHTMTTRDGTYRAYVHLSTATGQTLVRSGDANLSTANEGVSINIEADAFLQLQENGPYNIDLIELIFLDAGGAVPADVVANVGQTRPYQLSEFERPLVELTGVKFEQAFDDNGNGQFDRLVVSLEVDVVRDGFYSWGFKLTDQLAQEIDFGSGSAFLDHGLNELLVTFEGTKIGAFGVNGPYQLRDLLVQGSGASLVVTDIGLTEAYRVSEFEGALNNEPPIADAGPDRTIEAVGPSTSVLLDGSVSSDPDDDSLAYEWRDSAGRLVATTATANVSLPLGAHTFTLTVDDGRGGTATDDVTITVTDTTAPAISSLVASPNILWTPNHRMVPVSLTAAPLDAVDPDPVCAIMSVVSNEPANGQGDGDTAPDWITKGSLELDLRAERAGGGMGRVYTINVRCIDASGNAATGSAPVVVPHNQ